MLSRPTWHWPLAALLLFFGCLPAGCAPSRPEPSGVSHASQAPGELRLLVVDDPPLGAAIEQLRAEWKARTGTKIVVVEMESAALLAADHPPGSADGVIYPSRLLGTLAERGWIVRLPDDYHDNRELDWGDTFELLQLVETNWAGAPHAVSFGSPVLTLYYRSDVLAQAP